MEVANLVWERRWPRGERFAHVGRVEYCAPVVCVLNFRFWVLGFGCGVLDFGFWMLLSWYLGFGCWVLGVGVLGVGFLVFRF